MGLTRYYKTEGFYIYCIIRNVYTLMSGLTFNLKQYEKACFKLFRGWKINVRWWKTIPNFILPKMLLFTECVLYAAYIAVTPVLEEFRWKISCSSVIKWKKFVKYIAHYQIKNEAHAL